MPCTTYCLLRCDQAGHTRHLLPAQLRTQSSCLPALPRYNPQEVGKAASLLQAGAVLGRRFQPYESHLPFLLQLKVGPLRWWCCM